MRLVPKRQPMRPEIVVVVFLQLLKTRPRDIEQLELHLGRGDAIGKALDDVLLAAACGLHHLIDRPIAEFRQEPSAEDHGHLIQDDGLLVEEQVLPVGLRLENRQLGRISRASRIARIPRTSSPARTTRPARHLPQLLYDLIDGFSQFVFTLHDMLEFGFELDDVDLLAGVLLLDVGRDGEVVVLGGDVLVGHERGEVLHRLAVREGLEDVGDVGLG